MVPAVPCSAVMKNENCFGLFGSKSPVVAPTPFPIGPLEQAA